MQYIKVILQLPLMPPSGTGTEYVQGFVDATLAPIYANIDAGVLNVDDMLDAGWELDIPEVVSAEGDFDFTA